MGAYNKCEIIPLCNFFAVLKMQINTTEALKVEDMEIPNDQAVKIPFIKIIF